MDDREFQAFLERYGYSRKGYRRVRKGVKKRISRDMRELGCPSLKEYFTLLDERPALKERLDRLMSVTISRFFRDRSMWRTLDCKILPGLVSRAGSRMKVWSAGCACGEEAYTFMMLWKKLGERLGPLPELRLWATDVNPEAVNKARLGVYPYTSLKELPAEWRSEFLTVSDDGAEFAVSESLKPGIHWRVHSLLREAPPDSGFHLIFVRNSILTYLSESLMKEAFITVFDSLVEEGVLAVGAHEHLPSFIAGQTAATVHPCVYRKRTLVPDS